MPKERCQSVEISGGNRTSRRQQRKGRSRKEKKAVHFQTVRYGGFEETQVICYLWELVKLMEPVKPTHEPDMGSQKMRELERQIRGRVRVEMRRYFLRRKRRSVKLAAVVLLALASVVGLFTCVLGVDRVRGDSMYPYLNNGGWIVYSRIGAPAGRNDVVVFEKNGENFVKRVAGLPGDTVEISASGSRVVVNGTQVREDYVTLAMPDGGSDISQESKGNDGGQESAGNAISQESAGNNSGQERVGNDDGQGDAWRADQVAEQMGVPMTVMDGQYLVLGDNRSISIDSRDSRMGTVPAEEMRGRVVLVIRKNAN